MRKNLILIALALTAAGCGTIAVTLPPVTESPTGLHNDGRVVWHDLLTTTPEASRKFYGELFGWTFERPAMHVGIGGDDDYMLIRHNGELIGGVVNANALRTDVDISQWVTMLSVGDMDAAIAAAIAGGATVLTEPTDVGQRGTLAVIEGPAGELFAMVQTRDGDPPEMEPGINGFLWDELWTDDVSASTRFYKSVFGYERSDHAVAESGRQYHVMRKNDRPRVGLLAHPVEGKRPVWVNYIRVEDPAAITARVEELGGTVVLDAQRRDIGGEVALILGPSGAGIALQTWSFEREDE